jgi:hypothetical protein
MDTRDIVLPSSPKTEKLVPYIPLPTIVVLGLQKTLFMMEVAEGLVMYDDY